MAEAEQERFALERESFYAAFTQGGFMVNRPTDTLVFQGELPPHFAQAMEQIGPLLAFAAGAQDTQAGGRAMRAPTARIGGLVGM